MQERFDPARTEALTDPLLSPDLARRAIARIRALAEGAFDEQVEAARTRHGRGRHSAWTGDVGMACVLWNPITADDRSPTRDVF